MSTPIPVGATFEATHAASVEKEVRCEKCQAEYVYWMRRSATGHGMSLLFADNEGARDRAASRAEASVRRKLERGCDVVPCPACGWIQAHMLPKARRAHRAWMRMASLVLFILGALVFLPIAVGQSIPPSASPPVVLGLFAAMGLCCGAAVVLLVAKFILSWRYDPNADDEASRLRLGRMRAALRQELDKSKVVKPRTTRSGRQIRPAQPNSPENAPL